ncbi:hypothetical protein LPH50_04800 [Xylella taiwanensis]|uniref:Uncharacterized protein n=1 Tax=Xylella taiwanensis TaxID=1444770 RepID=Z9JHA2_9GAMM|nr:hypothetical protein [Xylella taiwanensis]AXI84413.1 hypothetical protein AB672_10975 [Xylella taiwanensis]EWS77122.1 hypothetical protein AF72_12445 [Xylella taiwanensis]MCD8455300.1 hypothetical protein [Xylella taiwanensis]MCD8457705.1 hypothetical protein [Xylella taiwanensis]MCD8459843.1 hypothetical protein [Xylella taiwanensis]
MTVINISPHDSPLLPSRRQRCLHDFKVDVAVAVGHAIAHVAPRHCDVPLGELGVAIHHFCGSLTADAEAHDDGAHPNVGETGAATLARDMDTGRLSRLDAAALGRRPPIWVVRSRDEHPSSVAVINMVAGDTIAGATPHRMGSTVFCPRVHPAALRHTETA